MLFICFNLIKDNTLARSRFHILDLSEHRDWPIVGHLNRESCLMSSLSCVGGDFPVTKPSETKDISPRKSERNLGKAERGIMAPLRRTEDGVWRKKENESEWIRQ